MMVQHKKEMKKMYRKTSNISRTLGGNEIVDNSDVVGASPVSAAPTTSSCSTEHLASMDWVKTTARGHKKHFNFGIWCDLYQRFYGNSYSIGKEYWIGLDLFNHDTCPSGHISRPDGKGVIHIDGSVQDCSISIANTLEILQSCTKPSIFSTNQWIGMPHLHEFTHMIRGSYCWHTEAETKWLLFCRWHFQILFLEWKLM